jgi:hypothetical protein
VRPHLTVICIASFRHSRWRRKAIFLRVVAILALAVHTAVDASLQFRQQWKTLALMMPSLPRCGSFGLIGMQASTAPPSAPGSTRSTSSCNGSSCNGSRACAGRLCAGLGPSPASLSSAGTPAGTGSMHVDKLIWSSWLASEGHRNKENELLIVLHGWSCIIPLPEDCAA